MKVRKILYFFGLGLCLAAFGAVFQEDPLKAWPMTPAIIGTGLTLFNFYHPRDRDQLKILEDILTQLKLLVEQLQ